MKPYQKNSQEIQFIRELENLSRVYSKEESILILVDKMEKMDQKLSKRKGLSNRKKMNPNRVSISKDRRLEIIVKDFDSKLPFRSSFQDFSNELYEGVYDLKMSA